VSTDGGQTWAEAEFLDPVQRHAWRRWKFEWLTPEQPGRYTVLARAKDATGGTQPDKHDRNYDTYVIDHPLPIEVFVGPKNGNLVQRFGDRVRYLSKSQMGGVDLPGRSHECFEFIFMKKSLFCSVAFSSRFLANTAQRLPHRLLLPGSSKVPACVQILSSVQISCNVAAEWQP
jgi:hypothetical protein